MDTQTALRTLGVSPPDLTGCRTLPEAQAAVQRWQDTTVRAAHRAVVLANHPDRHPDDDACARATALANAARDELLALQAVQRQPPPQAVSVVIYVNGAPMTGTSTSTWWRSGGW